MNPLKQMNEAMAYLEAHLLEEIDLEQMARIAGCTEYHFRRMFSYLAGISLGRYILLRKLAIAGDMLRNGRKVIDCAVMLGYDSPDAFTKAFHGMTPLYRMKAGMRRLASTRISFEDTRAEKSSILSWA
ncbi:AraC family transcriptional regulator [Eubacteriales bacterium OttesenSCG-928-A19]|nr:AraC family transcriptional regulator [Eubacteriales bacterium OttesenSCG-928-A19]